MDADFRGSLMDWSTIYPLIFWTGTSCATEEKEEKDRKITSAIIARMYNFSRIQQFIKQYIINKKNAD
jgi:hypothetical protein